METKRFDNRWLMGSWIRKTSIVKGVRIGDLREAIGAGRRAMTRYTKDRPGTGSPDLPHVKTIVQMAIVMNVPIEEAMEVAAKTVVEDAVADLQDRGYDRFVENYSHDLMGADVDTANV